MKYGIAGILGFGIGIGNLFLIFLVQKKAGILFISIKKWYRESAFWIISAGMAGAGVYLTWIFEEWSYIWGVEMLLCAYLLPLSWIDFRYRILPDLFHIVYGILFFIYKLRFGSTYDFWNGIFAAACIFLFLGLICLLKKEHFGLGDFKLLCVCGFFVGMPGIFYLFFRGLVAAALYGLVQMGRRKADLKTEFPFVPFLLFGVLV